MTRTTLVLAVVGAFVFGSIATGTMTYAAPGGSGDMLIVEAINALTIAVQGINPTVNVDPTPITVNVDSEQTKNIIQAIGLTGTTVTCPDNSQVTDTRVKSFVMDEFSVLPNFFAVNDNFVLSMYKAETDGQTFEITGITGTNLCGFTLTPLTFSMTGQCTPGTQVDVTTNVGVTATMNANVACI